MIKAVFPEVWAFDAEWVPDPLAGRLLYDLGDQVGNEEVMAEMFKHGGATEENPTPCLKMVQCRLVSVVAVVRRVLDGTVSLNLHSLPKRGQEVSEFDLIKNFLSGVGRRKPQLVGYNSSQADIRIFLQRALVLGVTVADFIQRPDKPWQGPDYFAKANDHHLDLFQLLHGWGGRGPSLHEIATLSGIPGKLDCDGQQVYSHWLQGNLADIVAYNECDALTTYLVWLRMAYIAGHFTEEEYRLEQGRVRTLLQEEIAAGAPHLEKFQERWDYLEKRVIG